MPLLASFARLSLTRDPSSTNISHSRRSKLRSIKQAAKAKLRRGNDQAMPRRLQEEVIVISDDDDDDDDDDNDDNDDERLEFQNPRPALVALPARHTQHMVKDEADESESADDDESDFSDPPSPSIPRRRLSLPQRLGNAERRNITPGLASEGPSDTSAGSIAPFIAHNVPTILLPDSADEDPGYVTAPQDSPQPIAAKTSAQTTTRPSRSQRKSPQETECPYYHEKKFKVNMFRGPGYEKFPVVLGTISGHKTFCDEWDARAKLNEHSSENADGSTSTRPARPHADLEREDLCLNGVLQIFPEIEHAFVRTMHQKRQDELSSSNSVSLEECWSVHVAEIADMKSYPQQKNLKRKASSVMEDETGVTIAWKKNNPKIPTYYRAAIILLATGFDHIPTHYISKTVYEKESLFDTFNFLSGLESEYNFRSSANNHYRRLKFPRPNLEAKYQRKTFEEIDGDQYVAIVNELQAARQHQARETNRVKRQKASAEEEAENLAMHVAQGSMVECQCCFDDKPINRSVSCEGEDAHFFCNDCVRRQAESQVGEMKYEMLCMDTSGCKAKLCTERVAQAMPLKLYDKLAFNQQQAEISLANIDGLEACPFCDFRAICEPVEVDSIFDCRNSDCAVASCRRCKEKSHLPKTCKEIQHEKGLGARHTVEEARSEAMMRTCPKCRIKLIKEYGCNKMVCTNCHTTMCYVCKQDISGKAGAGYDHFQRSGAACALHDGTEVDRHKQEADAAEAAAIAKVRAEHDDIDEEALRIDTGNKGNDKPVKVTAGHRPIVPPVRERPLMGVHHYHHAMWPMMDVQAAGNNVFQARNPQAPGENMFQAVPFNMPALLQNPWQDVDPNAFNNHRNLGMPDAMPINMPLPQYQMPARTPQSQMPAPIPQYQLPARIPQYQLPARIPAQHMPANLGNDFEQIRNLIGLQNPLPDPEIAPDVRVQRHAALVAQMQQQRQAERERHLIVQRQVLALHQLEAGVQPPTRVRRQA